MTLHPGTINWLVIVNPNAGKCRGRKDWPVISQLLEKENISHTVAFTAKKGDAIHIALNAVKSGCRRIITVGGDGTLNEVVNGLFLNDVCETTDICLGLIPVGTGNDWGRMFGIPLDYAGATRIIKENRTMLHDVGKIIYHEGKQERTRYFINIAGLGFESVVVRRTNRMKERGYGGKLIYFYNLLATLFSYRNTPATLSIDNQKITSDIFSVNIGNGRYCGGGMRQTPDALPDDGLLDITVINSMGKFEIISNLAILYNGKILEHPKIDGYRCRKLQVNSVKLLDVECDGESLGNTPAIFTVLPAAVNIIYSTRLIQ
ncbi:MAG TPA: diacylglycerol kinase family protein [Bacteroidales bacterium]|nr:diacylglycerol kinase family protein [Bacteroidales bacterium]